MMEKNVRNYLSKIGRNGGKKSRRVLSSEIARKMVLVREARRAYEQFHSRCFWSYDPNYKVTEKDLVWVGRELMKSGDRRLWDLGVKLCR